MSGPSTSTGIRSRHRARSSESEPSVANVGEDARNRVGRTVGIEELYYGIIVALYAEDSWPVLQQALSEAIDPEPDGGLLLYTVD